MQHVASQIRKLSRQKLCCCLPLALARLLRMSCLTPAPHTHRTTYLGPWLIRQGQNGKWLHLQITPERRLKASLKFCSKKHEQAANEQNLKWRLAEPTRCAEAAMRQLLPLAPLPLPSRGILSHPHDSNQSDRNNRYSTAKFYKRLAGWVADELTDGLTDWLPCSAHAHQGRVLLGQNQTRIAGPTGPSALALALFYLPLVFGKCLPFCELWQKLLSLCSFVFIIVLRRAAKSFCPHYACEQCGIHLYVRVCGTTSCMCQCLCLAGRCVQQLSCSSPLLSPFVLPAAANQRRFN